MEAIINARVPEFKVQGFQNGSFKEVSNKDIEGKWALFFFYPADFTFVCPTELGDLQSKYEELKKMGVEVFSVSCDTHFVHKAWHDASETIKQIQYTMLGDPCAVLARFRRVQGRRGCRLSRHVLGEPGGIGKSGRGAGQQHRAQCRRTCS